MTYQALFSLLFKLVKNEERLELTFLDSLKLNKKGKEEFHSLGYKFVYSKSSLNKALVWIFWYSCLKFSLLSSTNTLSHYSSTCPKYMGNISMSLTWKIGLAIPSVSLKLPWVIFMSFSLLKDRYPLSVHLDSYYFHLWDCPLYIFRYLVYQLLIWPVEGFISFMFTKWLPTSTSCKRRPRVSKIVP